MKNIIIKKPKNDSLESQLIVLYQAFSNIKSQEKVVFDFSQLDWIYPLVILPISAYIKENNSDFIWPKNENIKSYLKNIFFPLGTQTITDCHHENYIPITFLTQYNQNQKKHIDSSFSEIIYKATSSIKGSHEAIVYPIIELINNIFEHSKKDYGWVFAQVYPKKKFLDLCIVDTGRGLKSGYKEEQNIDITDMEAINKTLEGYSTKPSKERGYGVKTSKQIICKALNGSFVIISGNAALISNQTENNTINFPLFNWQGVILSYRIGFPSGPVDIYPFLG